MRKGKQLVVCLILSLYKRRGFLYFSILTDEVGLSNHKNQLSKWITCLHFHCLMGFKTKKLKRTDFSFAFVLDLQSHLVRFRHVIYFCNHVKVNVHVLSLQGSILYWWNIYSYLIPCVHVCLACCLYTPPFLWLLVAERNCSIYLKKSA